MIALDAVRDKGSNLTGRISTIETPRVTRSFTGLIEAQPPRIIIIPHNPDQWESDHWSSNRPARIYLELAADGKTLIGTSRSREHFELVAFHGTSLDPPAAEQAAPESSSESDSPPEDGLDVHGTGTSWKLMRRNGKRITGQHWEFSSESGAFTWKDGSRMIASGSYHANLQDGHLDISVDQGKHNYQGTYQITQGIGGRLRVCVPEDSNAQRPKLISTKQGTLYELALTPASDSPE